MSRYPFLRYAPIPNVCDRDRDLPPASDAMRVIEALKPYRDYPEVRENIRALHRRFAELQDDQR